MPRTNLKGAARVLSQLCSRMLRAKQRAEERSADKGVQIAKDFSSGRKSLRQLAREDHPLALRHGAPKDRPDVINKQTGQFRSQWRRIALVIKGEHVPAVVNRSRVADFLKPGTSKMFPRPIDDTVGKVLEPIRIENLDQELRKLEA